MGRKIPAAILYRLQSEKVEHMRLLFQKGLKEGWKYATHIDYETLKYLATSVRHPINSEKEFSDYFWELEERFFKHMDNEEIDALMEGWYSAIRQLWEGASRYLNVCWKTDNLK